ncbi:MAG: hypothetical protein K1X78_21835 [Verrucomicrobiaceae bacterium]|nr:hypothetical protein [Verrucomicrobiaceae bacterium]
MKNVGPEWYCVHTKPKCEHSAAAVLRDVNGVETFCPRIRFQRSTERGKVWFVEALFPSYFFARFDAATACRAVRHSQNVIRIIEFGGHPVCVPDAAIERLREEMDYSEVREIRVGIKVGDNVEVAEGPMRGLSGIVESIHSGEERVRILLEFLGRQSVVEVNASKLISEKTPREVVSSSVR